MPVSEWSNANMVDRSEREPYEGPAVIYEAQLEVTAGSPATSAGKKDATVEGGSVGRSDSGAGSSVDLDSAITDAGWKRTPALDSDGNETTGYEVTARQIREGLVKQRRTGK